MNGTLGALLSLNLSSTDKERIQILSGLDVTEIVDTVVYNKH